MKFRTISLAIATVIISLTSYIHHPVTANEQISQAPNPQAQKITIERLGIGGVKLGISEAQVKKILGKPVKIENSFMAAIGKVRTLKYTGITIDLAEGVKPQQFTVYQIKTNSPKYTTVDKIKVGDKPSQIISTYGKNDILQEGKVSRLNYAIEEPSPAGLNFTIKNGKVAEIFCFYVMN
ncbi:hypothetical protein [Fortiea contorta]|uniref:hypothetical protein n=1 Tax=Fortiea contorta TaxID=1892405 RepID=UPI00034DDFD8|nr:hypothetical protein [Fortiea contorta]